MEWRDVALILALLLSISSLLFAEQGPQGETGPQGPAGSSGNGSGSNDGNNYTTGISFSGTTTKTLTLTRLGLADLTASFSDEGNTTNQMRTAINNSGPYNVTINASEVLNPPWLTSYTETDPVFLDNNASIWTAIGLRANNTRVTDLNSTLTSNDSAQANLINALYLANTTTNTRIDSVNSTAQSKAGTGTCASGQFVNGTTTSGILCGTPPSSSGGGNTVNITTCTRTTPGQLDCLVNMSAGNKYVVEARAAVNGSTNAFYTLLRRNGTIVDIVPVRQAAATDITTAMLQYANNSANAGLWNFSLNTTLNAASINASSIIIQVVS